MTSADENRVRERAYAMWLAGGMIDGMADDHWLSAEQEIRSEAGTPQMAERTAASASADGKPARAKAGVRKVGAVKVGAGKTGAGKTGVGKAGASKAVVAAAPARARKADKDMIAAL